MGKGRQIAGIVWENHIQERPKCIWISTSPDLLQDAKRDLRDIGEFAGQLVVLPTAVH